MVQGSYFLGLVIEGSRSGSESIPLTDGSGSRRPKNMWIRWIRIRNNISPYLDPDQAEQSQRGFVRIQIYNTPLR
jgi:hypothetical protein